jgi:CDP-glycerol glycerophosphotransferase (TagB/SpsB family)
MTKDPLLSIIVVTWNNENFIEQALASCIDPDIQNYEIIVVHNASDDRTGEMVQRAIAGNEGLFQVIENEKNEGLGEARNIGMSQARGEYIMFLDGDDWYEPQGILRVTERLIAHSPDVLVFNHQRAWDTGRKKKNKLTHLLTERDVTSSEDRSIIMRNFCVCWNKAYKLSFIKSIEGQFPNGHYEDIIWTFRSLFFAQSCHVIPDAILNYRQRTGSITRSVDARHMDILKQYEGLLRTVRDNSDVADAYGLFAYQHARSQILNVVNSRDRLPHELENQFLAHASELLYRWRQLLGITKRDTQLRAAHTGRAWVYHTTRYAAAQKRATKRWLRTKKVRLKRRIYKHIMLRLPINDRRVYLESYWGKKAACNPLAIADSLEKTGKYEAIFGFQKKALVPVDFRYPVVRIGSLPYYLAMASSKFIVSNGNVGNAIVKREEQVHIQTQHGTPLKVMGLDIRPHRPRDMHWGAFAKRCRRWDYLLSSNPYSTRVWRQAMPYNYKVVESGYPRNDIFFNATASDTQAIKDRFGIPNGKKVALYAPTFRDEDRRGLRQPPVTPEAMLAALGNDYVLLLRSHYFTKDVIKASSDRIIDVAAHPVSEELFLVTDLLITDYSSSMFDYACLKRPILLFMYDYEEYKAKRGMYFDIREEPPGAIAETGEEFLQALRTRSFESADNMQLLERFSTKFCPWDDGQAADRVVEQVFNAQFRAL